MAGILRALHKAIHKSGCVAPGTAASLDHKNSFHCFCSSLCFLVLCFNVPFSVFSFSQNACPDANKKEDWSGNTKKQKAGTALHRQAVPAGKTDL